MEIHSFSRNFKSHRIVLLMVLFGVLATMVQAQPSSAEEAKRINGEIIPIDWTEAGENRLGFIRHLPLGPVLGISPFNYPLNLSCHKLAPAIAAGNSFS